MNRNDWTREQIITIIPLLKSRNYNFVMCNKFALNKTNKEIYQLIDEEFSNLFISASEIYYVLLHDIDNMFCKQCGKRVAFLSSHYREFCSNSCKSKYFIIKKGNPSLNKEVVTKRIQTFMNRYGVRNPSCLSEIKNKKLHTFRVKFGVDYPGQIESGKLKSKLTRFSKYGNSKYNGREKSIRTCIDRYGVENPQQYHIKHHDQLTEAYIREHFVKNDLFLLNAFMDHFNLTASTANDYKNKFNIIEPSRQTFLEKDIVKYLKSIYSGSIQCQNKTILNKKELDIYIPDKQLAIEFDGLMYHSYGISDTSKFNNYADEYALAHVNKTNLCEKQRIQLFHIFENEWINTHTQCIWKSLLSNKLGLSTKLYARKCTIKHVSRLDAKQFLINNHLQGACIDKIRIGLYYHNELVSLMTFGRPRFNKQYTWELLRFCTKLNIVIVGGASKLLNYFRKVYPGNIISYANRRWSIGGLYEKLGFKRLDVTSPNYFYFTEKDRFLCSRVQFQKHKLSSKLKIFDATLSETQNMYINGYRKIYDCGNVVYALS